MTLKEDQGHIVVIHKFYQRFNYVKNIYCQLEIFAKNSEVWNTFHEQISYFESQFFFTIAEYLRAIFRNGD